MSWVYNISSGVRVRIKSETQIKFLWRNFRKIEVVIGIKIKKYFNYDISSGIEFKVKVVIVVGVEIIIKS